MNKYFTFVFIVLTIFLSSLNAKSLEKMTLEEKVGQMFITYFEGDVFNNNAEFLIDNVKIGGIIFYNWSNDLEDPVKIKTMTQNIQDYASKKGLQRLFITLDQEGGRVSRLKKGVTELPGNAALGVADDSDLTFEAAKSIAEEMRQLGINLNLAPVVDVNCNSQNPVIGIRSFGADPVCVAKHGKAAAKGFQAGGVIPCLKHFPGHGDTTVDSHISLPVVSKPLDEIEKVELYPYKEIVQHVPAVMTSHIRFEALDSQNIATFSPTIIQGLLRNRFNFGGLVITDSLTMGGVADSSASLYQAAIKSIEAGCDIMIVGGGRLDGPDGNASHLDHVMRMYHGVLNAVRRGKIKESRIDESVNRILAAKQLFKKEESTVNFQNNEKIAKKIAYRSVELKKGTFPLDFSNRNILIVYPEILSDQIRRTDLISVGKSTSFVSFDHIAPSRDDMTNISSQITKCDHVIFCSYNAWKFKGQAELLEALAKQKPTTFIVTAYPNDQGLSALPQDIIVTYSPTTHSLQVASEYIRDTLHPFNISYDQALEIGNKVWYNESRQRVDQLTFWNKNEAFPSVGIGHFIWPPKGYEGHFSDGRFHDVVLFLKNQGVDIPEWLSDLKYPPWENRDRFYDEFNETKMAELRSFLVRTIPEQALYMVERLNSSFLPIIASAPEDKRQKLIKNFFNVFNSVNGPYILVDYLNFKHEGTNLKERYAGYGWGLKQVLENMQGEESGLSPQEDFVGSAKRVLINRIVHSPNRDLEQQWMEGWSNRLKTYLE